MFALRSHAWNHSLNHSKVITPVFNVGLAWTDAQYFGKTPHFTSGPLALGAKGFYIFVDIHLPLFRLNAQIPLHLIHKDAVY